ncbi:MAG TPA: M20 family metallopeptidase [Myxococcales bacterium]|jgi:succinyl-diaminopimelate desuccinylase|nr:M20 family metallopeptidase [Myxococcales bacterium]
MNAVELTRELVRIDTVNPVSPERPCAERLGRLLEDAGFAVRLHEFAPGRASVVARRDGGGTPFCFAGHIDTVPLGAAPWKHQPFGGEIDAGKLYGRGSSDMKSGVAAMVCAALELGRTPLRKAGLTLLLVAGEETGCEGALHLARSEGALGKASAMVVGEPTGNVPVIGHKGALWLRARTRGVTAHGSMPSMGVNAVVKAARAVLALDAFRFDVKPDPLLGEPTLNIGLIQGGMNVNSVPDEAVIGIDMRTIPAQGHAALRARLQELLGDEVELSSIVDLPGVRTREDDPFVRSITEIVARITGEPAVTGTATYFTDASVLTPAFGGIPTVVLGPGEMALCHQTDEHCRVERIEQAAAAYVEIARERCGA